MGHTLKDGRHFETDSCEVRCNDSSKPTACKRREAIWISNIARAFWAHGGICFSRGHGPPRFEVQGLGRFLEIKSDSFESLFLVTDVQTHAKVHASKGLDQNDELSFE